MSPTEAVQLMVSAGTLITAIASLITAWRAVGIVRDTHYLVNGLSTRNLELEKKESRAEGVASARD